MPDSTTTNTASPIGGWHELQIPSRKQCPKLLYLFSTQQDSFSLLLTDLISIWDQSLDKDGMLQEAARQHTSIDPSVSSEQFKIFLSKLCKSLQDGDNVIAKDDLKGKDRDARQGLLLKTKIALPKPLKPLEWTFSLTPQNASEMAERILRPSLHEVAVSQEKINSLLRIVGDKDRVISRLLDRIGNSAVDLGLIFPGITGMASRKGGHVSVADAKRYVPGMAGFDEKAWTGLFSNDDGYEGADRTGLSNLVRGCEKCFAHTKEEHEDWIKDLGNSNQVDLNGDESVTSSPKATRRKTAQRQRDRGDALTESDEDDDFERQPTPPGIKAKNAGAGKTSPNTASSEEDDDVKKRPSKPTSSKKIGSIGRRNATKSSEPSKRTLKSSSPPGSDRPTPPPPPHRRPSNISTSTATATASEEDDDAEAKSKPKHQPPLSQRGQRKETPKLGALKKKPRAKPSPSPLPSSPSPTPVEPPPRRSTPIKTAPTQSHRRSQRLATESPTRDDEISKPASDEEIDLDMDRDSRPAWSTPRHRLGRVGARKSLTTTPDKPSARSSPARTTTQTASQATPTKKLGRLGARRPRQAESRSAGAEDSSSSTGVDSKNKKRTNSDRGRDRDRDRKRGHGGGGDVDGASEDEDTASTDSTTTSRPGTKRKGGLASHRRAKSSPDQTSDTTRSETKIAAAERATKEKEEEEEEETAEEKANRRRAELKRSIEAAAGAKKKRRF